MMISHSWYEAVAKGVGMREVEAVLRGGTADGQHVAVIAWPLDRQSRGLPHSLIRVTVIDGVAQVHGEDPALLDRVARAGATWELYRLLAPGGDAPADPPFEYVLANSTSDERDVAPGGSAPPLDRLRPATGIGPWPGGGSQFSRTSAR